MASARSYIEGNGCIGIAPSVDCNSKQPFINPYRQGRMLSTEYYNREATLNEGDGKYQDAEIVHCGPAIICKHPVTDTL